jgi:hypothetical protein
VEDVKKHRFYSVSSKGQIVEDVKKHRFYSVSSKCEKRNRDDGIISMKNILVAFDEIGTKWEERQLVRN